MLISLALIFLGGLAAGTLCQRLRLPRIVGMLVLAAAVLGILVTAPLGAIGIDASCRRLLTRTTEERTGEQ